MVVPLLLVGQCLVEEFSELVKVSIKAINFEKTIPDLEEVFVEEKKWISF